MATQSISSLVVAKSSLPQLPKQAEMVMTTFWLSKEPVTTSPDSAEADVPSSTDEPPAQQTFLVGELVTGQVAITHHCKM